MGLMRLLRRFPRVRLGTSVAIAHDNRPMLALAFDLSEGGLGLEMHVPPPEEGTRVRVCFQLPGQPEPLEMAGRISHATHFQDEGLFRVGLSFVDLSPHERKALRRYINMRRFLFGDLRAPSTNPAVERRVTERLDRARRHDQLM